MDRLRRYGSRAWAFMVRDFRETVSYRLAFLMQVWGIFFSVTLFFFIARIFDGAVAPSLDRYGSRYFPFVIVGLAFMGFMTTGMNVFAGSIRQGQVTGTLEAMLVTPTSLTTIITASALWSFARSAINVVVYLAVATFFGFGLADADWLAAMLVLALSVTAFSGLGILSAAFVLAFKKGNPAGAVLGAMSALFAGVFFPVDLLPPWLQSVSKLLPLTYALEGMRQAVINGRGVVAVGVNLLALAGFSAVILPLAVLAFRLAVRYAKREGSLAHY